MNQRKTLLGIAFLILITILAYIPALEAGFIWDDDAYITENQVLRESDGLSKIWFEPGTTPQYYPLVFTMFWVEYRLWGLNPTGYHLINVLLHGLVASLLWVALRGLGLRVAWVAAAVFALHPVHVESVAWITERKNVLSGFYLLSFLLFVRTCSPFCVVRAVPVRWLAYAGSLILFLFALSSKTVACSLPAALLLLAWWKRGVLERRVIGLTMPYFLLGLIFAGITIWMERQHVGAQGIDWSLSFLDRGLIAGRAVWFYLAKLLVPINLTFIYSRWEINSHAWWQYLYPVGSLLGAVILWRLRSRIGRGPLVGLLFFAGTLLPALGFIDVYPMRYSFVADHFQYLASVGMLTLFLVVLDSGLANMGRSSPRVLWGTGALLLCLLGISTWDRARDFRDPETLWSDTIAKNSAAWMAHHNLGMIYEEQERWAECIERYRAAIQLQPELPQTHFNLGTVFAKQRDWKTASEHFQRAIEYAPQYADAHLNFANCLFAQGNLQAAAEGFRRALSLDPQNPLVHKNLALALKGLEQWVEAAHHYREALQFAPTDAQAAHRLAWILAAAPDDTARSGEEAVKLASLLCEGSGFRHGPYLMTLAAAYAEVGDFDAAVAAVDRAVAIAKGSDDEKLLAELETARQRYLSRKPTRIE